MPPSPHARPSSPASTPTDPTPGTLHGRPLLLAFVPPDPVFAAQVLAAGADLVLLRVSTTPHLPNLPTATLDQASRWLTSLPRERAGLHVDPTGDDPLHHWLTLHEPRHVLTGPQAGGALEASVRAWGGQPWRLELPLDHDDAIEWLPLGWTGAEPDQEVPTLVSVLEDLSDGWAHAGTEQCDWTLADLARATRHHRLLLSVDRPSAQVATVLSAAPAVRGFWVRVAPDADEREPTYAHAFGHEVGIEEVRALAGQLTQHAARSEQVGADGVAAGRQEQIVNLHLPNDDLQRSPMEPRFQAAVRLGEVHDATLLCFVWRTEPPAYTATWATWQAHELADAARQWAHDLGVAGARVTVSGPAAD
jgi:hypothetical protein